MAAIDLLMQQHREAEALFERLRTNPESDKVALLGRLTEALTLHAALEEQFVYPLLRAHGLEGEVIRSLHEHDEMKRLISEILSMKRRDPRLGTVTAQLEEVVQRHVAEEERTVLPALRERVDAAALEDAEARMRSAMQRLEQGGLLEAADEQQPPAV
ncbi:MAG: hemerythrin domain-containing protein [Myxococcaceae bacterium]|nr:hemerythrin domain-containing protein [Myxococcaceae bacterium]